MKPDRKKFFILITAITVLGAFFRLYGILEQPPLADEIQTAYTAQNYLERGHFIPTMPHHPNLRNLLVFLSIEEFGINGMGIRFFSLLFGILSIPLLGLFLYKLTESVSAAGLAAFFLAVDPLSITFSRQTIQEVYVVFFSLLGIYLLMLSLDRLDARTGGEMWPIFLLPLAGIAFGLGIASKYNTAFAVLIGLALVLWKTARSGRINLALYAVLCLVVLPATVLLLTDASWFGRGYDLSDWIFMRKANLERMSIKYLPVVTETNPDKWAWQWFVNPLLGYASFTMTNTGKILTIGMGNPLVWLLVLPSSLYLAITTRLRKRYALVQALFWCAYLPFAATTQRPIFFLSAVAVVPFACCLVSAALDDAIGTSRPKLFYGYLAAVLAASILLFPLCRGKALDYAYTAALTERFSPHR